jgi:hypothetical protein
MLFYGFPHKDTRKFSSNINQVKPVTAPDQARHTSGQKGCIKHQNLRTSRVLLITKNDWNVDQNPAKLPKVKRTGHLTCC